MTELIRKARQINKRMDGILFWSVALRTGIYGSEDVIASAGELRSFTEEYTTFYNIARRLADMDSGTDVAAVLAKVDNSVRNAVDGLSQVLILAAQKVSPRGELPLEIPALPGNM